MPARLPSRSQLTIPQTRDAVIEQIVEMFGGWKFDQERAEKMLKGVSRKDWKKLPKEVQAYGRRSHGIQAAMQAEKDGADSELIVGALLHDIGHVFSPPSPAGMRATYDDMHGIYGDLWLRNIFVTETCQAVLLHVPAKRYLVTTRKEYYDHLSSGSKRSLKVQGGFMSPKEVDEFEYHPHYKVGVKVRIYDDNAKVKGLKLDPIEKYVKHMEAAMKKRRPAAAEASTKKKY